MEEERNITKPSSIAWFALAELVARKEKEKAINVARLLCHSLPDRGYAYHLEADLLWYLGDTQTATNRYLAASHTYEQQKKWPLAYAAAQTAYNLGNTQPDVVRQLVQTAAGANLKPQCITHLAELFSFLEKGSVDTAYMQTCLGTLLDLRNDPAQYPAATWIGHVLQETCLNNELAAWIQARVK